MKTPPTDNDQVQLQRVLAHGTSPQSPLSSLSSALSCSQTKSLSQVHVLTLQTDASLIQATTTLADADSCVDLESIQCHSETLAVDHSDSDDMSSTGDDSVRNVAAETAATRLLMDIVAASILIVLALGGICGMGHCNVREW
jgi:hypothetical protein